MQIGTPNQVHNEDSQGIKWVSNLKILGISFTNNNNEIIKRNFGPKLAQIQKEIAQWRRRNLTPLGRITVIKSLLISKFVHLLTALPNPSQTELKQLESLLFEFLWAGKRDPVKRAKVIQNYSNGGLCMIDLQAFVKSMKMSWLRRLFTTKMAWQEVIRNQLPDIQEILVYGSKKIFKISASIKKSLLEKCIRSICRL